MSWILCRNVTWTSRWCEEFKMMDIHFEQLINQKMFACSVYSALLQYIMKLWKICHNPIGNVMEDCEAKTKKYRHEYGRCKTVCSVSFSLLSSNAQRIFLLKTDLLPLETDINACGDAHLYAIPIWWRTYYIYKNYLCWVENCISLSFAMLFDCILIKLENKQQQQHPTSIFMLYYIP